MISRRGLTVIYLNHIFIRPKLSRWYQCASHSYYPTALVEMWDFFFHSIWKIACMTTGLCCLETEKGLRRHPIGRLLTTAQHTPRAFPFGICFTLVSREYVAQAGHVWPAISGGGGVSIFLFVWENNSSFKHLKTSKPSTFLRGLCEKQEVWLSPTVGVFPPNYSTNSRGMWPH